jgi:hypothetical protein
MARDVRLEKADVASATKRAERKGHTMNRSNRKGEAITIVIGLMVVMTMIMSAIAAAVLGGATGQGDDPPPGPGVAEIHFQSSLERFETRNGTARSELDSLQEAHDLVLVAQVDLIGIAQARQKTEEDLKDADPEDAAEQEGLRAELEEISSQEQAAMRAYDAAVASYEGRLSAMEGVIGALESAGDAVDRAAAELGEGGAGFDTSGDVGAAQGRLDSLTTTFPTAEEVVEENAPHIDWEGEEEGDGPVEMGDRAWLVVAALDETFTVIEAEVLEQQLSDSDDSSRLQARRIADAYWQDEEVVLVKLVRLFQDERPQVTDIVGEPYSQLVGGSDPDDAPTQLDDPPPQGDTPTVDLVPAEVD